MPAILYYVACFAAVHFEAKRRGIVGVPRAELPKLRIVMAERGHLFLPILILLVVMYSGYSAPLAALAGTLACFPVAAFRKSTRGDVTLTNIIEAMVDGAKNSLAVALACASAGIMIGVVTLSGLGIVFTQWVVGLAQDALFVALVMTMLAGHRARQRTADDTVLYPPDRAAHSGDHEARRDRAGGAYVRVLLSRFCRRSRRRSRSPCSPQPGLPRLTCGPAVGRR